MANVSQKLGRFGENTAKSFLIRKGYEIIDLNFHTPYGEIDIICKHNDQLIFVEVKTRKSMKFGYGEQAIDHYKREKIQKSIDFYLNKINILSPDFRFDAIIIEISQKGKKIRHIKAVSLED